MKKSLYNFISRRNEGTVLYNGATDKLAQIDGRLAAMYENNPPEEIASLYPAFYEFLEMNRFIVPDEENEGFRVRESWQKADEKSDSFSIAINPTLNCNLRCWYCYENHAGSMVMTPEVMDKTKKAIARIIHETDKRGLHIGFFGGEPLLFTDKVVMPLMKYALDEIGKASRNIVFSYSFVTNGTLVSDSLVEFLTSIECPGSFQITFDGNLEEHDRVRFFGDRMGSYGIIKNNLSKLIRIPKASITIRCNYTGDNLASFIDLADDLADNPVLVESGKISIDLHQVWQDKRCGEDESIKEVERDVRETFQTAGFRVSQPRRSSGYRCYADSLNHVLINYNGDLYRCTARDFTPEIKEGELNGDGGFVMNERSEERDRKKWGNKTCHACRAYPICTGGCSQNILEHGALEGCIYGYSEDDKDSLFEERISGLINGIIQKDINKE